MLLHADPVAEQGAPRERRGRVDGKHPDPTPSRAELRDQGRGRRRLADTRRAGETHDVSLARHRRQGRHQVAQLRSPVLDERDQPADRAGVTRKGRSTSWSTSTVRATPHLLNDRHEPPTTRHAQPE